MDMKILVAIEECLNLEAAKRKQTLYSGETEKVDDKIIMLINTTMSTDNKEHHSTFYDEIVSRINALNDPRFKKKNGSLNEAAFCGYARIDDSTWSDIKNGKTMPQKKTLLKLVIALRLDEEEARKLMGPASFNPIEMQDQVILACIRLGIYDVDQMTDILFEYQSMCKEPFDCIYETQEMIRERKAAAKAEKDAKSPKSNKSSAK